jgi:tight adherence protein C
MLILSSALFALSAMLLTLFVAEVANSRPRAIARRLADLEKAARGKRVTGIAKLKLEISTLFLRVGDFVLGSREDRAQLKERLAQAGYRAPNSVAMFWGGRLLLTLGLASFGFFTAGIASSSFPVVLFVTLWLLVVGWIGPSIFLGRAQRAREQEIQSALPDTLDLLVVCVEAGLGLNQAWLRVSDEIKSVSVAMSEELSLVNLQIRAGVPREDALRALGSRTKSPDMRSLSAMLIQTDRFGTSVSTALRVQADSLRQRRRSRAEEQAAKTAVKLSFPLVLCIMPSLFIVVLGGAVIEMIKGFTNF